MKLLSCLISFTIMVGIQGSEGIYAYQKQIDLGWNTYREMISSVISDDGTDFKPVVKERIAVVESQVCAEEDKEPYEQCDPSISSTLGCSSATEFSTLERSCSNAPCTILRYIEDNGPKVISDLMSADSYVERFGIVMNQVEFLWRIFCKCRGAVDTTISFVKNYDGFAFTFFGTDRSSFDKMVNSLDWEAVQGVAEGYLNAICGVENEEDCLPVFNKWQTNQAAFFDNTFSGIDSCVSLLRAENEIGSYMESQIYKTGSTAMSHLNGMVEAYMKMEDKIICDAGCAPQMQKRFYSSCCIKTAGEGLSSEGMKKLYVKLLKSLYFPDEEEPPELKGAVDRFMAMFRPATFCGDKTDVYKEMKKQCDAEEV